MPSSTSASVDPMAIRSEYRSYFTVSFSADSTILVADSGVGRCVIRSRLRNNFVLILRHFTWKVTSTYCVLYTQDSSSDLLPESPKDLKPRNSCPSGPARNFVRNKSIHHPPMCFSHKLGDSDRTAGAPMTCFRTYEPLK